MPHIPHIQRRAYNAAYNVPATHVVAYIVISKLQIDFPHSIPAQKMLICENIPFIPALALLFLYFLLSKNVGEIQFVIGVSVKSIICAHKRQTNLVLYCFVQVAYSYTQ